MLPLVGSTCRGKGQAWVGGRVQGAPWEAYSMLLWQPRAMSGACSFLTLLESNNLLLLLLFQYLQADMLLSL